MPSRIIREGWLDSETIDQLSAEDERFFLRLCLKADDYGRFSANPFLLKSALYPLKDDVRTTDVSRWLAACEKAGLVRCYTHGHKPYLEIFKFGQRTRAESSKYPEPPAQADTAQLPGISLTDAARKPAHARQLTDRCPTGDGPPRTESETKSESNLRPPGKAGGKSATATRWGPNHPLFDALARAEGSDPMQLTESHAGRIRKALSEIVDAVPAGTNIADEIAARAGQYKRVMPAGTRLTAMALAINWGKCVPPATAAAVSASLPEPEAWRQHLKDNYSGESWAESAAAYAWAEMPAQWREKIAREMKHGRAA